MWKKDEELAARPEAATQTSPKLQSQAPGERAKIGRSIRIRGEVEGDEDLVIDGRVEGSIDLKRNAVTVGSGGEVQANINGRVVTVDGKVTGNLTAEEQVILSGSAQVEGDIKAPRVVLEDGASFRGGVDMGEHARNGSSPSKSEAPSSAVSSSSRGGREEATSPAESPKEKVLAATTTKESSSAGKDGTSKKASAGQGS